MRTGPSPSGIVRQAAEGGHQGRQRAVAVPGRDQRQASEAARAGREGQGGGDRAPPRATRRSRCLGISRRSEASRAISRSPPGTRSATSKHTTSAGTASAPAGRAHRPARRRRPSRGGARRAPIRRATRPRGAAPRDPATGTAKTSTGRPGTRSVAFAKGASPRRAGIRRGRDRDGQQRGGAGSGRSAARGAIVGGRRRPRELNSRLRPADTARGGLVRRGGAERAHDRSGSPSCVLGVPLLAVGRLRHRRRLAPKSARSLDSGAAALDAFAPLAGTKPRALEEGLAESPLRFGLAGVGAVAAVPGGRGAAGAARSEAEAAPRQGRQRRRRCRASSCARPRARRRRPRARAQLAEAGEICFHSGDAREGGRVLREGARTSAAPPRSCTRLKQLDRCARALPARRPGRDRRHDLRPAGEVRSRRGRLRARPGARASPPRCTTRPAST